MKEIKRRGRKPKPIHKKAVTLLERIKRKMATQAELDAKEQEVLAAVSALSSQVDVVIANQGTGDTAPMIAFLQQVIDGLTAISTKLQPTTPPAIPPIV